MTRVGRAPAGSAACPVLAIDESQASPSRTTSVASIRSPGSIGLRIAGSLTL
jgi:hypothetical protein